MKNKQMKNSTIWIALSAVIFLLANLLIFQKEARKDWRQYQKEYYIEQGMLDSAKIEIISVTPTLTGEPEMCLTCHIGIEEISPSHPVESFGCVMCHQGDGQTLDEDMAHADMRGGKNPSDLSVARESCSSSPDGTACHNGFGEDESWRNMVDRVERSLQATAAGAIANVRFTFGMSRSQMPEYGTAAVTDDSVYNDEFPESLNSIFEKVHADSIKGSLHPVEANFVESCLEGGCHLHAEAPVQNYYHRSSGCATCHTPYSTDGYYQGSDVTIDRSEPGHMTLHQITTAIPYSTCNSCHNRGIYSMKQMEFLERDDLQPDSLEFLSAQDRRRKEYYIPMAQYALCEVTLDCIDCHTHNEIMGNGDIMPHKDAAVEVQCLDCHGTIESDPEYHVIQSTDEPDAFIAAQNPYLKPAVGDTVAVTRRGTLLPAVQKVDGRWQQISKVDGSLFHVPVVKGSGCEQDLHEQESPSCHTCHDISGEEHI
jgi:hypothetical protein